MSGKKRKSENIEILTRPALLYRINSMKTLRDKALASFIYLTGARISEILGMTKVIIQYDTTIKPKVKSGSEEIKIEPLKKESVEVLGEQDLILIHNVPSLKRRDKIPRRTIPIVISQERSFVEIFIKYFNQLEPDTPLFNITRERAWQIINKQMGLYNHFLIHERCTHLVTYKDFTDLHLMNFRGWKNTQPASIYTHLNPKQLIEKMR